MNHKRRILIALLFLIPLTFAGGAFAHSQWRRYKHFKELLAFVEQRYRPQIAYLEGYRFPRPPPSPGTSREAEIALFSAPEILSAAVETQKQVHHAIKSADFKEFRDDNFGSIAHGSGTLLSGSSVTFITYVGRTKDQNFPFQLCFDIEQLTALAQSP
jgi:hypothetical protein